MDLETVDDKKISAIDVQRTYLEAAKQAYQKRDEVTDDVLKRWEFTLDALESNPMKLATSIDWVIKLNLLTHLMEKQGKGLNDDTIRNAALQYHDIDQQKGLFYYLQNNGLVERIVNDSEIEYAMLNPPTNTRAYLRSRAGEIKEVTDADWGGFKIKTRKNTMIVDIKEPLAGTKEQVSSLFDNYTSPEKLVEQLGQVPGIEVRKAGLFGRAYTGLTRAIDIPDISGREWKNSD